MIRRSAALALLALSACGAMPPERGVTVRHVESTVSAGNGARWHLFLFDPGLSRSLDDRIALARDATRDDPDCRWVGASKEDILDQTMAQGARYGDTVLAAPLLCKG